MEILGSTVLCCWVCCSSLVLSVIEGKRGRGYKIEKRFCDRIFRVHFLEWPICLSIVVQDSKNFHRIVIIKNMIKGLPEEAPLS